MRRRAFLEAMLLGSAAGVSACAAPELQRPLVASTPAPQAPPVLHGRAPRIGLALGGGAARGFAHIGVIKALETQGIIPDLVVGTSAGSVVGALYASGLDPFALQRLALQLDERRLTDWTLTERGWLKGQALERFVNQQTGGRGIEALKRPFGAVATDLELGDMVVFRQGNTGTAVRASAAIPGVFSPVTIAGRDYVDGGLVAPVPAKAARQMGAEMVIAVDISAKPSGRQGQGGFDLLLDTIAIMGGAISREELKSADVVIRPDVRRLAAGSFDTRNEAILEGERAAYAAIDAIRQRIARFRST